MEYSPSKIFAIFLLFFGGLNGSVLKDHPNVTALSSQPRIYLYKNFLTPDECDYLIERSKDQLQPSYIVDDESGQNVLHPGRTSRGMFWPNDAKDPVVSAIELRIANMIEMPVENGEGLQVLNYQLHEEYQPHYDYFNPELQDVLANGGQRIATCIMYLNTPEEGGETVFPDLSLTIKPIQCNALFFYNCVPKGQIDPFTLHGSSPVLRGEKWVATKWIHKRMYF